MKNNKQTKFVVVVGGVISGLGKGVVTASMGKILQEHGYNITLIKIDPYINYDAGTLRPTEHGEVWVTEDGGEIDQDLGTYERFLNRSIPKHNNITTGQIYQKVLDKERRGDYLGQTVQFIPHITDEVVNRIKYAAEGYDIAIIEIGGTVGDYENVPFVFGLKTLERELPAGSMVYVLVTYLPVPEHIGEMKTKPTQQAIRLLGQEGVIPDIIVCRSKEPIDEVRKKKIEAVSHVKIDHIIAAPDIDTIYQQPIELEKQELGKKVLNLLHLESKANPSWDQWSKHVYSLRLAPKKVAIAIIAKYLNVGAYVLTDSYLSICHALMHAGASLETKVDITWINAQRYEDDPTLLNELQKFNGILVPGGFGSTGIEGKISAIKYARVNNIPYLGLCYGMQLAVVEFARSIVGLAQAHTTEVDASCTYPVIDTLPLQRSYLATHSYGGTMRLGAYNAIIKPESRVGKLYEQQGRIRFENNSSMVHERHRHRYEVNPSYVTLMEEKGLRFSGYYLREDGTQLMEFLELPLHAFFVATQAHPEFTSRFMNPNPLFYGFIEAAYTSKD